MDLGTHIHFCNNSTDVIVGIDAFDDVAGGQNDDDDDDDTQNGLEHFDWAATIFLNLKLIEDFDHVR